MRFVYLAAIIIVTSLSDFTSTKAMEFKLTNGDTHSGSAANFDDLGLTIRLDIGCFSSRIGWSRLSQETLRELSTDPRAIKYVDPFIDPTPEELERARVRRKPVITLKEVERVENPMSTGVIAALGSPAGMMIALVFYLANLYAAFEVAMFRQRPIALVCGLSLILPGVGPIIFLSLPQGEDEESEPEMVAVAAPEPEPLAANPLAPSAGIGSPVATGSGLGLAGGGVAAATVASSLDGAVFKRGEVTFNRRFFETKFPGFFRVVASDAEKDLVLVVRAAKNEYVAKRISRITANEMHVQSMRGRFRGDDSICRDGRGAGSAQGRQELISGSVPTHWIF